MTEHTPPKQPAGCIEGIHHRAMEARSMDELAVVLRDAGEAILWLHTCLVIATRNSLYAKQMEQVQYGTDFDLHRHLRDDALSAHFRALGQRGEAVVASEGSTSQLNAATGALQSLFGAQWSVRAAAELLRPGVEYDVPRSAGGME